LIKTECFPFKIDKGEKMAKYVLIHEVGKELTAELGEPFAKAIKINHTLDAYWVGSFYLREEGRLYCEWDAKDTDSIREVIAKVAPDFKEDPIYEMELNICSEDYRE
jgi:hypothetical protein